MAGGEKRPIVVYGALGGNFAIAVMKFGAAAITGSSALLSEGIHSVVDTGNQLLLLLGIRRSGQAPDRVHPFGYGKELYFWTLLVAIILFGVGGGVAFYEGVTHLLHPQPVEDPFVGYVVLAIAFIIESVIWVLAFRSFLPTVGEDGIWHALRAGKDPTIVTVLAEDTAAMMGIVIASLGLFLSHRFDDSFFDAAASILIGILLAGVAIFLAFESRGLLVGESAGREVVEDIERIVAADPAVLSARRPLTMHLGPHEILVNLGVEFRPGISTAEIVQAVERLEQAIRAVHPDATRVAIEAEALRGRGPS